VYFQCKTFALELLAAIENVRVICLMCIFSETFALELLAAIENVRVICLMCILSARLLLQNYWLLLRMLE
jgi:hypothetical protein